MKGFWYLLAGLFGFFGVVSVLRTTERLLGGAGLLVTQVLLAFVALLLSAICLKKARSRDLSS